MHKGGGVVLLFSSSFCLSTRWVYACARTGFITMRDVIAAGCATIGGRNGYSLSRSAARDKYGRVAVGVVGNRLRVMLCAMSGRGYRRELR